MNKRINEEIDNNILVKAFDHLDCLAITDEKGRYIYVNKSWTQNMGGLTIEMVRGKYVNEIIPNTRIFEVLDTKSPIIGHAIKTSKNEDAFTTYIPILEKGEVIAGLIYVIIIGMSSAIEFTHKVNLLANKVEYYKQELKKIRGAKYTIDNIIGESDVILRMKKEIFNASRTSSTVLIEGETGCGKELVAHSIHALSTRASNAFVKVNCAAIPHELLESEFFGYEEGSFTGAKKGGKLGKFELANKGCLFLDEINQMPSVIQPKLLRVLQEKEIERIGGKESIAINTRVIAATNASLDKMVRDSKFRSDLYFRLNVINIKIPPLRERKDDIPMIADNILEKLNFQLGMTIPEITEESKERLKDYNWPGNIRELQNVIERAMNMSWSEPLEWKYFKQYFEDKSVLRESTNGFKNYKIKDMKSSLEREVILAELENCGYNKTQAAKNLGISRTLLYKKMEKYKLIKNV